MGCAARWFLRQPVAARAFAPRQAYRTAAIVAALVGCGFVAAIANAARGVRGGLASALGYGAVGGLAGLAVAVIVFGVAHRLAVGPRRDASTLQ